MASNATPSVETGAEKGGSASTSTDKRKSAEPLIAGIAVVLVTAVGWVVWEVGIATMFLFLVKALLWAIVVFGALGCVGFAVIAIASKKEDELRVARPSWDWKISGEAREQVVELAKTVKLVGEASHK